MSEWRTISIPRPLADAIILLIEELGYWHGLSAFVRQACREKLHAETVKWKPVGGEKEG